MKTFQNYIHLPTPRGTTTAVATSNVCVHGTTVVSIFMSVYMEQRSYPCHICGHGTKVVSLSYLCAWNTGRISDISVRMEQR